MAKAKKQKTTFKRVNLKMSIAAHARIMRNAKLHTRGNVSAWMTHSGQKYVPKSGERIQKIASYKKRA